MNVDEIVQQLRAKSSKLYAAIQALEGVDGRGSAPAKRRGRSPVITKPAANERQKRGMSAAGRKRIAEAMRKRWAAARKSGKKRL